MHINAAYIPQVDELVATAASRGETLTVVKVGHKYITLENSNGTTYKLNTETKRCTVNMHRRFNSFNPARSKS
jgi:hypothetical protein